MDLLFDLDGTLVDSAPGILDTLRAVLEAHGLPERCPVEASLIGPPLAKTLSAVSGIEDVAKLEALVASFKAIYDTGGYRNTRLFPGVAETLARLSQGGNRLFIVTNKRIAPTRKILVELGIDRWFTGVHALDEAEPPTPSKVVLVARVLRQWSILPPRALMVGDSADDARAAQENGIPFVFASYGFGKITETGAPVRADLHAFAHLPALLSPGEIEP